MYKAFELGISSKRKSRNVEKGRSIRKMLRLFVSMSVKEKHTRSFVLVCVGVDIFSSCLGVNNLLTAVKAEVAREHVRYAAGKREVQ